MAAVDYLNTKPLIDGFSQSDVARQMELLLDYPAHVADMLLSDQVDIGLVPVAVLGLMKEYHIISNHCIGCDGEVASVCLFSQVPIEQVEKVILDYQSRTSVALFKILCRKYWNVDPQMVQGHEGYETEMLGTTAVLVIGDRALLQRQVSPYIYDLGLAWKTLTDLPFLFAAWVANKQLPEAFIRDFSRATASGFEHLDRVIAAHPFTGYDLQTYYTKNIDYRLDAPKLEACRLFLEMIEKENSGPTSFVLPA